MHEMTSIAQTVWRRVMQQWPPTRWPLLIGAFLALPLAFWPWFAVTVCRGDALCTGYTASSVTETIAFNPMRVNLELYFNDHQALGRFYPFFDVLLTVFMIIGVLGSVWVHGRIRTRAQTVGAVVLTLWSGAFIGFNLSMIWRVFAILNTTYNRPILAVAPTKGLYLFILVMVLFIAGLVPLWWNIWRNRASIATSRAQRHIQRLSLLAYLTTGIATLGGIIWFCGYYGIYWLLPPDCPPTPLFGSAHCNERISGQRGYAQLLGNAHFGPITITFTYWIWGALLVCSGAALLFTFWTRATNRTQGIAYWVWLGSITLFSLLSFIGIRVLEAAILGDALTDGPAITLLGIALLVGGGLLRTTQQISVRPPSVMKGFQDSDSDFEIAISDLDE